MITAMMTNQRGPMVLADRVAVMPPIEGSDRLAVNTDVGIFLALGAIGYGIRWLFFFAIALGMEIVIPTPLGARDKRFIDNYWKFVDRYKITVFSGVPTTLAPGDAAAPGQPVGQCGPGHTATHNHDFDQPRLVRRHLSPPLSRR